MTRAASDVTAAALLSRVASVLEARGVEGVELVKCQWLRAEDEQVARVKRGAVVIDAVRDGVEHTSYLPGAGEQTHTPSGNPEQAAVIAAEIIARLGMRRRERERFETWRAPKDLLAALHAADEAALRDGLRGSFHASPFGQILKIDWSSSWGSRTSDTERALRLGAEALAGLGFAATWCPGLGWLRVVPTAQDVLAAEGEQTVLDAVRDEEPVPETERECEFCEPMAAE